MPVPVGYKAVRREKPGRSFDLSADWASTIIQKRGDWLAGEYPQLARDFRKNRDLNVLARKYVLDDYRISSRTGKRIIYHALEILAEKKVLEAEHLEGINPDILPKIGFNWNCDGEETEKSRKTKKTKKLRRKLVCV